MRVSRHASTAAQHSTAHAQPGHRKQNSTDESDATAGLSTTGQRTYAAELEQESDLPRSFSAHGQYERSKQAAVGIRLNIVSLVVHFGV